VRLKGLLKPAGQTRSPLLAAAALVAWRTEAQGNPTKMAVRVSCSRAPRTRVLRPGAGELPLCCVPLRPGLGRYQALLLASHTARARALSGSCWGSGCSSAWQWRWGSQREWAQSSGCWEGAQTLAAALAHAHCGAATEAACGARAQAGTVCQRGGGVAAGAGSRAQGGLGQSVRGSQRGS
jgi:hypothetical protein